MTKLTLDEFGEQMDKMIKENNVQMLVTLPTNSIEAEVVDNFGNVSTIQFYIALNAIESIVKKLKQDMGITDQEKWGEIVESLMDLVKKGLVE